jgi:two-component system capsular synthesis sensor histidine kinase RcsC
MVRVLFLEDEKVLVEDLPILLKEEGFSVMSTVSIADALKWFGEVDFDVVLLDIMMRPAEDMDAERVNHGRRTGIEVARQMRATKPDVPIVAFTVVSDLEVLAQIREAGVIRIIKKPAELDRITRVLREVVSAERH